MSIGHALLLADQEAMIINSRERFSLESQFNSDESRLRFTLLNNYLAEARPVVNITTVTVVDVGLTIIQVMDLVSRLIDLFCLISLCFSGRTKPDHDHECASDSEVARRTSPLDTQ